MAKKPDLTGILARTETTARPADNSDLDDGNIQPLGVGLRAGEIAALGAIADEIGTSRNRLLRFALRWFIKEYRAGRVDPSEYLEEAQPVKKSLRLP